MNLNSPDLLEIWLESCIVDLSPAIDARKLHVLQTNHAL